MRPAFRRFLPTAPLLVAVTLGLIAPEQALAQWDRDTASGQALAEKGRFAESRRMLEKAQSEAERFGPKDPRLAKSLTNLAGLNQTLGNYAQAESLYKRAVAIREKVGGHDDLMLAETLRKLAGLYELEARFKEAKPLMEKVVAIDKKSRSACKVA